jgi:hypothetical protein
MKPKSKSLTIQGAIAIAAFAAAVPVLSRMGVVIDAELKQSLILLLGAVVAYGLRRAQGGLK